MVKTKRNKSKKVKGSRVLGEFQSQYNSSLNNNDNTTEDMLDILDNEHNQQFRGNNNNVYNGNNIANLLGANNMQMSQSMGHMNQMQMPQHMNQMQMPQPLDQMHQMQMPLGQMGQMGHMGQMGQMGQMGPMFMGQTGQMQNDVDPLHLQNFSPMANNNMQMQMPAGLRNLSQMASDAHIALNANNKYNMNYNNLSELNINPNDLNDTQQSLGNMNINNDVNTLNQLNNNNKPTVNLNNLAKLQNGGRINYSLTL